MTRKYLELRSGNNLLPSTSQSIAYLGHTLNLTDQEEQIFSSFRDSTKRNIKKAVKEGVEVKIDGSLKSVEEFYRLNSMTRKEHGLPPQPFSFFEKIYDHIISRNLGLVVLASYEEKDSENQVFVQPVLADIEISGVVLTRDGDTLAPYYTFSFDDSRHLIRTLKFVHRDPIYRDFFTKLEKQRGN